MSTYWSFEEHSQKSLNRDPFEAEFFTGEENTEEVYGRTDSLVREAIQNSLDAKDPNFNGPVHVRFSISSSTQIIPRSSVEILLNGLVPHLDAVGNEKVNNAKGVPEMPFLVVEDFGTHGLCGDPTWCGIKPPDDGKCYDFYWFWRNIGRSGKFGTNLGRWGLGKTVFPATSHINALFGLTVRSEDQRKLLMGQAIMKLHEIDTTKYVPEGFFCDSDKSDNLQMPFENHSIIQQFEDMFCLTRKNEPGLSIVIPYPFERIQTAEILRSVIVHFFSPILKGKLTVNVCSPEYDPGEISADTIRDIAGTLDWDKEKRYTLPPFNLTEWAIKQQESNSLCILNDPQDEKVPTWGEHLFNPDKLEELRNIFEKGGRIAIRVPMTIQKKNNIIEKSFFDVFIEPDSDLNKSEDRFIREGMTISDISTLSGVRGIRGIVMVDDLQLSALLGDTEGPSHVDWGTGESRPDENYVKWKKRVSFVRNAIVKLLSLLYPPPEGLNEDWLQDIFSIANPSIPGSKPKKRKKGVDPPPPPPPPPPPSPKSFEMLYCDNGFRIRSIGDPDRTPDKIIIRVAYDLSEGNPFHEYSPIDFKFDASGSNPIDVASKNIHFELRENNRFVIVPESDDFELRVTGFDATRDIIVDAKPVVPETSEEVN